MRIVLALLSFVFVMVLALLSLPSLVLVIGYDAMGDQGTADKWMRRSPLDWWLRRMETA